MQISLQQAKLRAHHFRRQNDPAQALLLYEHILATVPLADEIRLRIADVFVELHAEVAAIDVYRGLALHSLQSGHPLIALSALTALQALHAPITDVEALLVNNYSYGSPTLARFAIKPAPVSGATFVEIPEFFSTTVLESAQKKAAKTAMDFSIFARYQEQFHPIPFLSKLAPESLLAVTRSLRRLQLNDREILLEQGEIGDSLYLVASGELKVSTCHKGVNQDIAHVFENALLGEMALITRQPRMATVESIGEADVLEVRQETLNQVICKVPSVRESLDRFSRERLIKNLMQTSPIFSLFNRTQQSVLLRSFEGHEVEAGTEIIREGEKGRGLFLIAAGTCDVISQAEGYPVCLASLGVGDMFGEMSVVTDQPTAATVRAMTHTTLLFLARVYVERLAREFPQIKQYFEQLAFKRAHDNSMQLLCGSIPQEAVEVDLSDVVSV